MALDTWLAFFLASWIISLSPGAGAIAIEISDLNHFNIEITYLTYRFLSDCSPALRVCRGRGNQR